MYKKTGMDLPNNFYILKFDIVQKFSVFCKAGKPSYFEKSF